MEEAKNICLWALSSVMLCDLFKQVVQHSGMILSMEYLAQLTEQAMVATNDYDEYELEKSK